MGRKKTKRGTDKEILCVEDKIWTLTYYQPPKLAERAKHRFRHFQAPQKVSYIPFPLNVQRSASKSSTPAGTKIQIPTHIISFLNWPQEQSTDSVTLLSVAKGSNIPLLSGLNVQVPQVHLQRVQIPSLSSATERVDSTRSDLI